MHYSLTIETKTESYLSFFSTVRVILQNLLFLKKKFLQYNKRKAFWCLPLLSVIQVKVTSICTYMLR
jgi:hypothetical protein